MIKVQELRIGNHILLKEKVVQLCGVTDNGFYIYEDRKIVFNLIEKAKPIELTEEILLKFGFEKGYTKGVFKLGDFTIDFYSKTFKFKREWIDINFKYLHQLQNLYWCLYGKELEIKL